MARAESTIATLQSLRQICRTIEETLTSDGRAVDPALTNEFICQATSLFLAVANPAQYWTEMRNSLLNAAAFATMHDLRLVDRMRVDGATPAKDLALATGTDEVWLRESLSRLAQRHCFEEVEAGVFAHTDNSRWLLANPDAAASIAPPFGASGLIGNPDVNNNGSHASDISADQTGRDSVQEIVDAYPWAQIEGTVVHIAGGDGSTAAHLVKAFPRLSSIVQDTRIDPNIVVQIAHQGLAGRVRFDVRECSMPPDTTHAATLFLDNRARSNIDCARGLGAATRALVGCGRGIVLIVVDVAAGRPKSRYVGLLAAVDSRIKVVKEYGRVGRGVYSLEIRLERG